MDVSALTQAIGSLGFPVVACIALYVQQNKNNEKHAQEMDKLSETINNNTLAITKLIAKLGGEDK
jgi:hypothetical protein